MISSRNPFTEHQTFVRYYNCSGYDVNSIPLEQRKNHLLVSCTSRWVYFLRVSTFLAYGHFTIDCVGLTACALVGGLFSFQGAVFCQQSVVMYITSTIGMMCWFAGNTTSVILSINRCLVIYDQDLAEQLFSGKRTLIWLCVPFFGSFVFVWLVPPVLFNSIDSSAIFNPHLHYLPDDPFTFLQVLITCTLVVFTSLGFIYQQYLASIPILVFTGYICHQGSPAVIYLCMNQTIRNTILKETKLATILIKAVQLPDQCLLI
uniref:7TM GPCR serpentine receptor class x (Srx) domain-containing protein n=1 Tax=Ditylenchus dipsaci TaxID=166011 RepID=A0A915EA65_9BILA